MHIALAFTLSSSQRLSHKFPFVIFVKKKTNLPYVFMVCTLMRRSIQNFNIPPPTQAYPRHLTVHRAQGGGEFELVISCSDNIIRL